MSESEHFHDREKPLIGSRDVTRDLVADGVHWRVFERDVPYERRSRRVLVFESEGLSRFVRSFPADWRALHDEELYGLS